HLSGLYYDIKNSKRPDNLREFKRQVKDVLMEIRDFKIGTQNKTITDETLKLIFTSAGMQSEDPLHKNMYLELGEKLSAKDIYKQQLRFGLGEHRRAKPKGDAQKQPALKREKRPTTPPGTRKE
ncbi:unnamed protein product, partial [marine sediment metagenome]